MYIYIIKVKSENVYSPVPECKYSHTFRSMTALFFTGDSRDRGEDLVRHLLEHPCQQILFSFVH